MYPEKQLSYKGTIDSQGGPNGDGEIYREDTYFFKGYRGDRRLGLCYEKYKYLHYGEYNVIIEGSGIQITQDCQYVGSFKNNSHHGKGRKIQNGVIIEGLFEQNQLRQISLIEFDNSDLQFFTKKLKNLQPQKSIKISDNSIYRINQNKGDIIFENGDYQQGNFELGILKEGLYYNKIEDKIYIGSFELGYLNTETGMSFDGKVLIKGKFDFGIMNGYSVIIWFNDKMQQLQKLVYVFSNGNPIKVSEFKPKLWQQELLDSKQIKRPYKIEVDGRFLVFQLEKQEPFNKICIDILIHYEEGNIKDLEIMNYKNVFSNIVINEKDIAQMYEGPGLLGMKHSENNQNRYKYNKLWYQKKDIDQYTGEYKIYHKYIFGKLIVKNQEVYKDRDIYQVQQEKQNECAQDAQSNNYNQKIQGQINKFIENLNDKLLKTVYDNGKKQVENAEGVKQHLNIEQNKQILQEEL